MAVRVLVVDDEEVMRELFSRVLRVKKYEVTTVKNGYQAIDKVKEDSFDIIFLDILMPGMDGLETFKVIQKIKPGIKVVMITGFAVEDKIKEALKIGAFGYLNKPFDIVEIVKMVKRALATRTSTDEHG